MVISRLQPSIKFFLLLSLWAASLPGGTAPDGRPSSYRLDAGDRISIQVFDEPDMSIETRISDRGTISYPFLGELQVVGMTVLELEESITRRLKGPYLIDPEVAVSIVSYRPFYVNGEVQKPGGFPFSPGLTVRKAISLAGGFRERANRSRINVVRDKAANKNPAPIGLDDQVLPGDIITVERSFF